MSILPKVGKVARSKMCWYDIYCEEISTSYKEKVERYNTLNFVYEKYPVSTLGISGDAKTNCQIYFELHALHEEIKKLYIIMNNEGIEFPRIG